VCGDEAKKAVSFFESRNIVTSTRRVFLRQPCIDSVENMSGCRLCEQRQLVGQRTPEKAGSVGIR